MSPNEEFDELVKKREKANKLFITGFLCIISILFLGAIVFLAILEELSYVYTIILVIMVPVLVILLCSWGFTSYYRNKKYKVIIFNQIMSEKGLTFVLNPEKDSNTISRDELDETLMCSVNNSVYSTNDLIYGKVDGFSLRSIDLDYYYMVSTGKSTIKVQIFLGRVYAIDLDFNKEDHLVIKEETSILKGKRIGDLKRIEFESMKFNKEYNVYSNDEQKAFYYIKPNIMEKIDSINDSFDGKLLIAIYGSRLYIGRYDNENKFEMSGISSISDLTSQLDEQINFIKLCIEAFKR